MAIKWQLNEQLGLWESQDDRLVLPGSLANPNFWFSLPSLTIVHLRCFKLWIDISGETSIKLQGQFTTNFWPVSSVIPEKLFLFPEASDVIPLDTLNTHRSISFNCHLVGLIIIVLVIACMFARWVEAFPCHMAGALAVAKKLLENVFAVWGIGFIKFCDQDIHFTGQTTWVFMRTLQNSWNYYCLQQSQIIRQGW